MSFLRTRILFTWIVLLLLLRFTLPAISQVQPFVLPPPANAEEALRFSFFTYDHNLPLNAKLLPLDSTAAHTRYSLTFDSVHDQRVTAILSLPKQFPAPY